MKNIVPKFSLPLSSPLSSSTHCNVCSCNKSHKITFSSSTLTSSHPLELLFSDVWTSPISSIDGFQYYVIFVDHYTRYIWYYPLKRKFHVYDVYVCFKALVENKFKHWIVTLYSDNGGEYQALYNFLSTNVYPILLHHHIHLNTMVFPNDVIAILLKPVYLFSLIHRCL